jgi:type II secretory pathway pseudopilin PulG
VKFMSTGRVSRSRRSRESGYILISILFAVTIFIILLAMAAPSIKTRIKRGREEELIHRAKQYTRGIQLYYRKFGRFPNSIDELENTNNVRFLRRKYNDPITGKDEWKLIRFGQATVKPRPAYLQGATPAGSIGTPAGGAAGRPGTGAAGQGQGALGAGTAGQGALGAGISSASSISKPLSNGPTLGGGPIVGISSTSDKEGLKEIDGKKKYSEWEFVYDPSLDPNGRRGNGAQGIPGGAQGGPGGGINPAGQGLQTSPGGMGERPTRPQR